MLPLPLLFTLAVAPLPDDVLLKTPEQSFGYENLYALREGKLWVKPNPRRGAQGDWALFDGTGVPSGKGAKTFLPEDRVASFATEGLMVVALSNRGRFYVWQPTLFTPPAWEEKVGQPIAGALTLPESRDWTFSMSVQVAPKKRRTPMHDIDGYYEDAAGNRVEFGFTATVYVLDPDGQRIRYWDTGLPPAFYKAFATPERGRFVAERLSASGSTLFVIDKAGKMFTRMMDYEMNGACPGLRYTFEKKRQSRGEQILSLFEAERVLPLESWRAQPALPLEGQAEQTTRISIHLTGQGNAARELRVQGRDAQGRAGYWWKPIFEPAWRFEPTGESYEPSAAIARGAPRPPGRPLDLTYSGTLTRLGAPALEAQLVDFDYYDTPATLRVRAGGKSYDLALHTFDAWGPTVQQQEHPSLVGSPFGEPKLLLGTLEVPDSLLASPEPEVRAFVDKYLRHFHHVHEAFSISADDARVELHTRRIQRKGTALFDYAVPIPLDGVFTRALTREDLARYQETNLTHLVDAPDLLLPDAASLGPADLPRVQLAVRRNRALLAEIRRRNLEEKKAHLEEGVVSALAAAAFVPVNALSDALDLPAHQPLAAGLALTGGHVLEQYAEMNLKRVITNPEDTRRAVAVLEQRIRADEALAKRLAR